MRNLLLLSALVSAALAFATSVRADHPVTVTSCGLPITFDRVPSRAVSHDMNISEIMFALGLQDRMVGVSGITGWYKMTPEFARARGAIPEIAAKNPSVENLLSVDPDFFFAGWYYGMRPGESVTPSGLAEFGIDTYVLTESCAHVLEEQPRADMELLYIDILNIGRIFDREAKARALIDEYKQRIAAVERAKANGDPLRVFLFDNGEEKPFTAGKYAMPTAIIEAAGAVNIMDDVAASWGRVGWESVVARNPEFIIIVGYQDGSWQDRWQFLKNFPPLAELDAIKNDRFIVLGYTEMTPGPNNIGAVEKLSAAFRAQQRLN